MGPPGNGLAMAKTKVRPFFWGSSIGCPCEMMFSCI